MRITIVGCGSIGSRLAKAADDMEEVKDKDLTAGQGFCIYTTYTGAFLKFPAIGSK